MKTYYQALVSTAFTLLILVAAFTVLKPFVLPLMWASVIAIGTWPLHRQVVERLGSSGSLAAFCSTGIVTLGVALPLLGILLFLIQDIVTLSAFLSAANAEGRPAPEWLRDLPLAGDFLSRKWEQVIARPGQLQGLAQEYFTAKLGGIEEFGRSLLVDIAGRIANMVFALWILFFFFRDGDRLLRYMSVMGFKWLHARWPSYAYNVPNAVRSAVNGLVLVGLAEGVLVAMLLAAAQVPGAVTLGVMTAALAFIPLAGPVFLGLVGLYLVGQGQQAMAFTVFIVGNAVLMVADYWVRPRLIQGRTHMPFLAVLFGIFGGIAAMGLLGVILGPVILALFFVLMREAAVDESADLEF